MFSLAILMILFSGKSSEIMTHLVSFSAQ